VCGANYVNVPTLSRLKGILGCEFAELLAGLDGDAEEQGVSGRGPSIACPGR
jgi:hypothetical protein